MVSSRTHRFVFDDGLHVEVDFEGDSETPSELRIGTAGTETGKVRLDAEDAARAFECMRKLLDHSVCQEHGFHRTFACLACQKDAVEEQRQ